MSFNAMNSYISAGGRFSKLGFAAIVSSVSDVEGFAVASACPAIFTFSRFRYFKLGGNLNDILCPFEFCKLSRVRVDGRVDRAPGRNATQLLHCISRLVSFGRFLSS